MTTTTTTTTSTTTTTATTTTTLVGHAALSVSDKDSADDLAWDSADLAFLDQVEKDLEKKQNQTIASQGKQ